MKRLLLLVPLLFSSQTFARDLAPADLHPEQVFAGFPAIGATWKAWCGSWQEKVDCLVELGETALIVDKTFQVAYESIIRSEKWDSMVTLTRLAKPDPLFAGWKNHRRTNQVSAYANTVMIEYKTSQGGVQAALFTFPRNRVSDWYGFGNAMRLISYGGRSEKAPPPKPEVKKPQKKVGRTPRH